MKLFRLLPALATAALAIGLSPAGAAVVDFEAKTAFSCVPGSGPTQVDNGMRYTYDFFVCYYSPAQPADFPTPPPSTVMASGFSDTTFSLDAGGAFDLESVDLAFGPFTHGGLTSDTTEVIGTLAGGGTVSTTLTIDYSFDTYTLGWTGLSSVTFRQLASGSEYLAFDNMRYSTAAVPVSGTLLLAGLGMLGLGVRRRRQA